MLTISLSLQPYNLLPFSPPYTSTANSTHSSLQHWRMIYRFLDSSSGPTQALPPHCCPAIVGGEYTASDHRNDVQLKATFVGSKDVIITPAKPPPSAAALCVKKVGRKRESGNKENNDTEISTCIPQVNKVRCSIFLSDRNTFIVRPKNIYCDHCAVIQSR